MSNREVDYYMKGLPFDVRQEILKRLQDINSVTVKKLLEKNEGYPTFKGIGCSNESILAIIKQYAGKFRNANDIMIENDRMPFFSDPDDTYNSSVEYVELLKKKTEQELEEKFGCTWEEYIPKTIAAKEKEEDR